MKHFLIKALSTVFFTGYIPVAPGTFGTLWGVLLLYIVKHTTLVINMVFCGFFIIFSILVSEMAVKISRDEDPSWIVIDEVCGYVIGGVFVPVSVKYFVVHFIIFRLFDVLKPFPVKMVEQKVKGGAGIVLDDVASGVISGLIIFGFRYLNV